MSFSSYRHPAEVALAEPSKPAIIMADNGKIVTYAALVDRANRVAHALAQAGMEEGDTIAFLVENSERYPELIWGAKNSGLRYICMSTHLSPGDANYIIRDSGAKALIASHALAGLAQAATDELATGPLPGPQLFMIGGGAGRFADLDAILPHMSDQPLQGRRRGPSMLYSSGTTGRPKGVMTMLPDVGPDVPPPRFAMLQKQYGLGADTVFLNPGPFYHAAPNRFMVSTQRAGGTVVAFERFAPEPVLRAIETHRVTHGFFVPTMFGRMLALPQQARDRADTRTLRHAIHAAAPCSIMVKRAMIDWWGPVIDELYAGTEAFGHSFITSAEWLAHPGSVGRPAEGCQLKIVDEAGNSLPAGAQGRIMMSNGLRIAYHGDTDKTEALYDKDGFASLGDIGYVDEDGYLYLTDRESHMIIVGGVNVYPQEVERFLAEHDAIEDSAVIGIPDADMGEEIKAVIQLRHGFAPDAKMEAEIIRFCRDSLSLYKCPRSVDFVDQLPRSPMGKLSKKDIKQRYWQDIRQSI
ncbi:MAG: AMP-binding protein [Sphingobium sp.]